MTSRLTKHVDKNPHPEHRGGVWYRQTTRYTQTTKKTGPTKHHSPAGPMKDSAALTAATYKVIYACGAAVRVAVRRTAGAVTADDVAALLAESNRRDAERAARRAVAWLREGWAMSGSKRARRRLRRGRRGR